MTKLGLKIENPTIVIWSVFVTLTLLFMALATIGIIDSSFVNFPVVSGILLLLGGATIFTEEFGKRKGYKFKITDVTGTFIIVIAFVAIVFGFLVLTSIISPFEARWLLTIIYTLTLLAVGINLFK